MKTEGAFKDDPIQQRMVDAFLKGPMVAPGQFEEDIVAQAKALQEIDKTVEPEDVSAINTPEIAPQNLTHWH